METNKLLTLSSKKSLICFSIEKSISLKYFGFKVKSLLKTNNNVSPHPFDHSLLSQFGNVDYFLPSVLILASDSSFAGSFIFDHYEETNGFTSLSPLPSSRNKGKGYSFFFVDKHIEASITINVSIFNDADGFAISTSVTNLSKNPFIIKRLASVNLDLNGTSPTLYSFDGSWAHEKNLHTTVVNGGRLEIDSDTGSSSNFHNPFTIIRNNDTYYGFNLIYSGNHKTSVEVNDYDHIRIETGINDFLFSYKLKPGETFFAPEALIEVADSIDYLSSSFHKLINSHIIPERFEKRIPPILFNSWEGVYFDFNQEKLLKMAKEAKDLGAELFVVDDGWFGHRNDDSSSLGDWVDNPLKTGGLKDLADKVRSLGLQFGIWMEPEMISEDSDLFKKHPEYAMRIPNREPNRQRNQLMLDLTNDEAVKFIIDSVSNVLDLSKASYLKWDYNRNFSDVYSSSFNSFEYGYRYIVNLYKIMDVLTKKYPSVLFEGCASGGARFDLGILSFFPQIWCSDNTDPLSRLFIQTGSLIGYPAKVMCCHVSKPINDVTKRKSRLLDRFQIALMGNLGYELDPTKLSNQDRKDIKQEIGFYKGFRKFSFFADSYLLGDCYNSNISGDMLINSSKSKAFLIVALTGSYRGYLKIRGLNPKFSYQVNHHGKAYLGSYLMDKGIFINQSISKLKKDYTCQIMTFCYELERIKGE